MSQDQNLSDTSPHKLACYHLNFIRGARGLQVASRRRTKFFRLIAVMKIEQSLPRHTWLSCLVTVALVVKSLRQALFSTTSCSKLALLITHELFALSSCARIPRPHTVSLQYHRSSACHVQARGTSTATDPRPAPLLRYENEFVTYGSLFRR